MTYHLRLPANDDEWKRTLDALEGLHEVRMSYEARMAARLAAEPQPPQGSMAALQSTIGRKVSQ